MVQRHCGWQSKISWKFGYANRRCYANVIEFIKKDGYKLINLHNASTILVSYFVGLIAGGDDEELAGHALSFFIDGFETSSQVMAFVLYELAKNPHIQEHLHYEIIEVLAKYDNKLTHESLQDMTYLDNIVHGKLANNFMK